jgi:hypothetical protein
MKQVAAILLLAMSGIALASGFTPASANRMDGKCCRWSDGGRSHRYMVETRRAAMPQTCSAYAAACMRVTQPDRVQMCQAAKVQCMQTGVHVGPYSGRQFAGLRRM